MKAAVLASICIAVIWSLAVVGGAEGGTKGDTAESPLPVLPREQVVRVVYQSNLFPAVYHFVTDQDSVRAIVGTIEFVPKEMCECAHSELLKLEYPEQTIDMSICGHCLDYGGNYKMPTKLWSVLQSVREKEEAEPGDEPDLDPGRAE